MEKSLSLKLAARKHTRYLTILAGLVLVFMLGSMFIVKNPSGGSAATLLPQTLPVQLSGASAILNPAVNTTYIIGGYDRTHSTSSREIYSVDMNFATNPSSAGVSGFTGSLCLQASGAASVFNSITQRAYLIGGSNSFGNRIKTIAEVDLSDPSKIIEDRDIKCNVIPSTGNPPLSTNLLSVTDAVSGSGDYNSFTGRMRTAVFMNQQTMYVIGGTSGDYSLDDIFEDIYQIDTSTPGNLKIKKITSTVTGQQLLHLRKEYTVAFDPAVNKAFLFGGRKCVNPHTVSGKLTCDNYLIDSEASGSPYLSPNNDILQFDLNTNTITNLIYDNSSFPSAAPDKTVFDPVNHAAYLMSGVSDPFKNNMYSFSHILKFDTQTNTMSNTGREKLPSVEGYGAIVYNSQIYTFGGFNYNRSTSYVDSGSYVNGIYMINMSSPTAGSGSASLKINKKLLPRVRAGVANTSFDAYALREDDIIQVVLNISGAGANGGLSVYDDALDTLGGGGTAKCDPTDVDALAQGNISDGGTVLDNVYGGKTVSWSTTADASGNKQVSYYCKIKE